MATPPANPERLSDLLTTAVGLWLNVGNCESYTDLFRHWRGNRDLLEFAADYPMAQQPGAAAKMPNCIVLVEYARWAVTDQSPDSAIKDLYGQCDKLLKYSLPAGTDNGLKSVQTTVLAITGTVKGALAGRNGNWTDLTKALRQAGRRFDAAQGVSTSRTAQQPGVPDNPEYAALKDSNDCPATRVLHLATRCGAFGSEGITTSTWLTLHRLLSRIYHCDDTRPLAKNSAKVLLYHDKEDRGHVLDTSLSLVKSTVPGVHLDPLALGITVIGADMRESLRIGLRCCHERLVQDGTALRLSADVPMGWGILTGPSSGGLLAAGMVVTSRRQPLDSNRSATCALEIDWATKAESDDTRLDPADVRIGQIGAIIQKVDEAWQKTHRIDEFFGHEDDVKLWKQAHPTCRLPRINVVEDLQQLIQHLTQNQELDREIDRHSQSVFAEWENTRQAIADDMAAEDVDHRFDCYVEPSLRIEGPERKSDLQDEGEDKAAAVRREEKASQKREEFAVPGDPAAEQDEPLLNLLEFNLRGQPFRQTPNHNGDDETNETEAPPEWLKPGRNVVIYDNAGAGKTVCSHRIRHLLTDSKHRDRLCGDQRPLLVVWFDGRWPRKDGAKTGPCVSLPEAIARKLANETEREAAEYRALIEEIVAHALRDRRVVLVLDGFDQFDRKEQQHVADLFADRDSKAKFCRWIVTSRVHTIDEFRNDNRLFGNDDWTRVRIDPFDEAQQNQYFNKTDARKLCIGPRWLEAIGGEANRQSMSGLLQLPMVLAMIRVLVEDAIKNETAVPVFHSVSQLYLVTSRKLLARALQKNEAKVAARLKENQVCVPEFNAERRLTELEHVLTLIAFQLMLMENYNGDVDHEHLEDFEKLCRDRYVHDLRQRFRAADEFDRDDIRDEQKKRRDTWTWAVAVLKTIELNHRSVTEAYSDAGLAFRSRKMVECHAARYLTRYATKWDVFAGGNEELLVVDPEDDEQNLSALCAFNYTTHPEWKETWQLAINMPHKVVTAQDTNGVIRNAVIDPAITCQSLSALFRQPKPYPDRDIRPTELIYRAWHLFEFDLPLLKERQFLIGDRPISGNDLPEEQLRHLGEDLLLGAALGKRSVVQAREKVIAEFRASDNHPAQEIESRLDKVLIAEGKRVPLPADVTARPEILAEWQQQSSHEKSVTFLQCPPQSAIDEFLELPVEARTANTDPRINAAIREHENHVFEPVMMQATCVTRGMYAEFDSAFQSSEMEPDWGDGSLAETLERRASAFGEFRDDEAFPILCPNWFDAWCFCKWLGPEYRLPNEWEWEFACRAGTSSAYHFGEGLNGEQANCDGTYPHGSDGKSITLLFGPRLKRTTPAGSHRYSTNMFGLFDTHGNNWEWCQNLYDSTGNPQDSRSSRAVRGSSWNSNAIDCQSLIRGSYTQDHRNNYTGFRVCRRFCQLDLPEHQDT